MGEAEAIEFLNDRLKASKTNEAFFAAMKRG
jgi:transcription termination factor Rho